MERGWRRTEGTLPTIEIGGPHLKKGRKTLAAPPRGNAGKSGGPGRMSGLPFGLQKGGPNVSHMARVASTAIQKAHKPGGKASKDAATAVLLSQIDNEIKDREEELRNLSAIIQVEDPQSANAYRGNARALQQSIKDLKAKKALFLSGRDVGVQAFMGARLGAREQDPARFERPPPIPEDWAWRGPRPGPAIPGAAGGAPANPPPAPPLPGVHGLAPAAVRAAAAQAPVAVPVVPAPAPAFASRALSALGSVAKGAAKVAGYSALQFSTPASASSYMRSPQLSPVHSRTGWTYVSTDSPGLGPARSVKPSPLKQVASANVGEDNLEQEAEDVYDLLTPAQRDINEDLFSIAEETNHAHFHPLFLKQPAEWSDIDIHNASVAYANNASRSKSLNVSDDPGERRKSAEATLKSHRAAAIVSKQKTKALFTKGGREKGPSGKGLPFLPFHLPRAQSLHPSTSISVHHGPHADRGLDQSGTGFYPLGPVAHSVVPGAGLSSIYGLGPKASAVKEPIAPMKRKRKDFDPNFLGPRFSNEQYGGGADDGDEQDEEQGGEPPAKQMLLGLGDPEQEEGADQPDVEQDEYFAVDPEISNAVGLRPDGDYISTFHQGKHGLVSSMLSANADTRTLNDGAQFNSARRFAMGALAVEHGMPGADGLDAMAAEATDVENYMTPALSAQLYSQNSLPYIAGQYEGLMRTADAYASRPTFMNTPLNTLETATPEEQQAAQVAGNTGELAHPVDKTAASLLAVAQDNADDGAGSVEPPGATGSSGNDLGPVRTEPLDAVASAQRSAQDSANLVASNQVSTVPAISVGAPPGTFNLPVGAPIPAPPAAAPPAAAPVAPQAPDNQSSSAAQPEPQTITNETLSRLVLTHANANPSSEWANVLNELAANSSQRNRKALQGLLSSHANQKSQWYGGKEGLNVVTSNNDPLYLHSSPAVQRLLTELIPSAVRTHMSDAAKQQLISHLTSRGHSLDPHVSSNLS